METIGQLYVATPALLAKYGIEPSQIDPTAEIVTSRTDLSGLELGFGPHETFAPKIQIVNLPRYSSGPNTLVTEQALQAKGMQEVPSGWLVGRRER